MKKSLKKPKRNILLNPGPATTTDSVKDALVVPDICPREEDFVEVIQGIRRDLVSIVYGGDDYTAVLFTGSGTAAMDVAINSVVPPGKKLAVIVNGAYGERFVKIASVYGIECVEIAFPLDKAVDTSEVERVLAGDPEIACVAMIHMETTTGILNPIEEIGAIAKKYEKIFIVDAMSSFAGIPIDVKKSSIQFLLSSSNKCIQGMAGLVFVICEKNALEKTTTYLPRSFYLNLFSQYAFLEKDGQMQFTPPVQIAYALAQAIKEYFDEGGKARYDRYTETWRTLREGLLELGFELFLDEKLESHLLITVMEPDNPNYSFKKMHDALYARGFTIYPGKVQKNRTFRLAILGDIDKGDIQLFLGALRETLDGINVALR